MPEYKTVPTVERTVPVVEREASDAEIGANIGGVGGAVTGAVAGAAAGPVGAVVGAVVGGVAGALASGAAVAAVDRVDGDGRNDAGPIIDNGIPGVQTGGQAIDGTPDTRGILEKTADTLTGDHIDDKTGKYVPKNPVVDAEVGNGIPGVQTGGRAVDGTPDTRGIMEKTADTLTGDNIDDKTGKRVN